MPHDFDTHEVACVGPRVGRVFCVSSDTMEFQAYHHGHPDVASHYS